MANVSLTYDSALLAGALIVVDGASAAAQRVDARACMLLAVLAADKETTRFDDGWFSSFGKILGSIGWTATQIGWSATGQDSTDSGRESGEESKPPPPRRFAPMTAIDAYLAEQLGPPEIAQVHAMLDKVRASPRASAVWTEHTLSGATAVSVLALTATGPAGTTLVVNYNKMTAAAPVDAYPWASYSADGLSLRQAETKFTLNESVFQSIQAQVTQRVSPFIAKEVLELGT